MWKVSRGEKENLFTPYEKYEEIHDLAVAGVCLTLVLSTVEEYTLKKKKCQLFTYRLIKTYISLKTLLYL